MVEFWNQVQESRGTAGFLVRQGTEVRDEKLDAVDLLLICLQWSWRELLTSPQVSVNRTVSRPSACI